MPFHFPTCTRNSVTCSWAESMIPLVRDFELAVGGPVGVVACSFATQRFTVAGAFDAGMLDSEPGKYITRCVSLSDPLRDDTEFVKGYLSIGTLGFIVMVGTFNYALS